MRLTNLDHMVLPPGRVLSLDCSVTGPLGDVVPLSYDQRRHVAAGDRDGSWMALAFRLDVDVSLDRLAAAWARVVSRHGTLRTVMTRSPQGRLGLREADVTVGDWRGHDGGPGASSRDVLRQVLDGTCRPFARPSHRLCVVVPDDDPRPVLVIAGDHSHLDMWSLLVLLRDLRSCLDEEASLPTAAPFAEHTRRLAERAPARRAVKRWAEILADGEGVLPRFPLPLGDISTPRPDVVEMQDLLDTAGLDALTRAAAAAGVRVTALAFSAVADATLALSGHRLRAVFPVHSRYEPMWEQSVGWFITNSVLDCPDASPTGCAAALAEALELGSSPLAPILGHLDAELAPRGMFALSWLDTRRLAPVPGAHGIQYVTASILTDGVMVWFLVSDDGLHLRCRYPDTPEARTSVTAWLDAIGSRLRDLVPNENEGPARCGTLGRAGGA